jgi:hypothetical protein
MHKNLPEDDCAAEHRGVSEEEVDEEHNQPESGFGTCHWVYRFKEMTIKQMLMHYEQRKEQCFTPGT